MLVEFDDRGYIKIEGFVFEDPSEVKKYFFREEFRSCQDVSLAGQIKSFEVYFEDGQIKTEPENLVPFGNVLALLC